MKARNPRSLWSRILTILGSIAMLVGAVDPLEGSVIILPGSLLVALGTWLGSTEKRLVSYRVTVFILIAIGVAAMWALSSVGGFGGHSGRSMWWGVLILPYLIGWSMGIWGPASPRWLLVSGIAIGLWYLVLVAIIIKNSGQHHGSMPTMQSAMIFITFAGIGVLTIAGCIRRLREPISKPS